MNKIKLRKIIQNVFFGIWLILMLGLIPHIIETSHQYCPYAAICFGPLNLNGVFPYLPIVIVGLLIAVSTIFWGRKFCSYICFIGTIQEKIFSLNTSKRKITVPQKVHKFLSIGKYLVLLVTLIFSIFSIQYLFMPFCPIIAISLPKSITIFGVFTLLIIFGGGFFIDRLWCRYLCPYGALMNVFQQLGKLLKIKRHYISRSKELCVNCRQCMAHCPMNVDLQRYDLITDPNCIFCYKCIEKGPKKIDCIDTEFGKN